jgi:hypothetical protein
MIITSTRIKGDNKIVLNGDDGKTYHFVNDENASAWIAANTTGFPTLASISPTTAVAGAANTTVTLTGTNFNTNTSEVLVNNNPVARTFVSATSMTTVLPTLTVVGAQVWQISVRNLGVYQTAPKPFAFT